MRKIIVTFFGCAVVVLGVLLAQGNTVSPDDHSREVTTEDYTNMSYEERMATLSELEKRYREEGNTGAADFIANQMKLITN